MSQDLRDALGRLEAEVLRAPGPEPVTFVKIVERDAEHRTLHVIVEASDGRRWRKTPVYSEDHRVERVVVEELPPAPRPA